MAIGPIVQIFNRTTHTLFVMKDGRQSHIPPGISHVTADIVPYARQQNPVPGTEDPTSLEYQSLISVVNPDPDKQDYDRHPLDIVPDDVLAVLPKERIDRSRLAPDRQNATTMKTGFPTGRVGIDAPSDGMLDPSGAIAGSLGGA